MCNKKHFYLDYYYYWSQFCTLKHLSMVLNRLRPAEQGWTLNEL